MLLRGTLVSSTGICTRMNVYCYNGPNVQNVISKYGVEHLVPPFGGHFCYLVLIRPLVSPITRQVNSHKTPSGTLGNLNVVLVPSAYVVMTFFFPSK